MARRPRIEFEGGFYHVITRGNQKQRIFVEEKDYLKYLEFLVDYKGRYQFSLYAYVLMRNHVHLLIETGRVPLSKILQGINQRYTMHFNRRYGTVGHLFQGRYKAILCDKDGYLLTLVKYLHYNPVTAGVVKYPEEYRWSSHKQYLGLNQEGIVDTHLVLRMFSEDSNRGHRLYRKYMGEDVSISKEDLYKTVDQRILGDQDFVKKVTGKVSELNVTGRRWHEYSLGDVAGGIGEVFGIGLTELRGRGKSPGVMEGRRVFSLVAREYGYKGREIAKFLEKDPAAVSGYFRSERDLVETVEKVIPVLKRGR